MCIANLKWTGINWTAYSAHRTDDDYCIYNQVHSHDLKMLRLLFMCVSYSLELYKNHSIRACSCAADSYKSIICLYEKRIQLMDADIKWMHVIPLIHLNNNCKLFFVPNTIQFDRRYTFLAENWACFEQNWCLDYFCLRQKIKLHESIHCCYFGCITVVISIIIIFMKIRIIKLISNAMQKRRLNLVISAFFCKF